MTIEKKNDIWDNITADAKSFESLSTEGGKELSDLIRATTSIEDQIEDLEKDLKALKVNRQKYLFDLIPAKMAEMGMDKVVVDGSSVSLSSFVQASMPLPFQIQSITCSYNKKTDGTGGGASQSTLVVGKSGGRKFRFAIKFCSSFHA